MYVYECILEHVLVCLSVCECVLVGKYDVSGNNEKLFISQRMENVQQRTLHSIRDARVKERGEQNMAKLRR